MISESAGSEGVRHTAERRPHVEEAVDAAGDDIDALHDERVAAVLAADLAIAGEGLAGR